jgi:tRNA nucleotidyltransferase/poly(A) polymerase
VFDFYNGLTDITAKVLRPIDPAIFTLDPIRLTRTIQLLGRLQYRLSDDLLSILHPLLSEQADILPIRKREEYKKLFLYSKKPSHGLSIGRSIGLPDTSPVHDILDRIAGLMGRRTYTQ